MSEEPAGPDYRFTLANERTYLAWLRTALALLAGTVVLAPGLHQRLGETLGSLVEVVAYALTATIAVGAELRRRSNQRAIERGGRLPEPRLPWPVTVLTALLAVLLVLSLVE